MDTEKFRIKVEHFTYGKTKTINPIAKDIQNCPEESLGVIKSKIFSNVEFQNKYSEKENERSLGHLCGSQIILHKLYELKPELFDKDSVPNSNLEELLLKREQWLKKEAKGPGISLADLKGMLFFGSVIAVIVAILLVIFTDPEDSGLRCYMINGEKVCKYESDWKEIRGNFEDSVNNIPDNN
jgi:hypothetical protein